MADDAEEVEGDDEESESKGGKKKLIIIIALALVLLIGGGVAAYFLLFSGEGETVEEEEETIPGETVFYDLEEILVNVNSGGGKSKFLKVRVSLELENRAAIKKVEKVMPRVVDNFQTYLRELRIEDLKGSAGLYRLREELLIRASAAVAPAKVKDVLFKELLIQ